MSMLPFRCFVPHSRGLALATLLACVAVTGCGDSSDPGTPGAGAAASASALGPVPEVAFPPDLDREARVVIERTITNAQGEPDSVVRRRNIALAAQANGLDETAVTLWTDLLAVAPDDAQGWYHLACAQEATGDIDGAIASLQSAIQRDATYVPAHERLGFWFLRIGDIPRAGLAFQQALMRDELAINGRIGLALIEQDAGRLENAARVLAGVIAQHADEVYARSVYGSVLREVGRTDAAQIELEMGAGSSVRWTGRDPWSAEIQQYWVGTRATLAKGQALLAAGRPNEALQAVEPLLIGAPEDNAARIVAANALQRLGRGREGIEMLTEASVADPTDAIVHVNIARLCVSAGERDRAMAHTEKALELNDQLAAAHAQAASLYLQSERYEDAEAAAARAIALEVTSFEANFALGLAYFGQKRGPDAFEQLQLTRRRFPHRWEPYFQLATMLRNAGQREEALVFAQRAGELSPGNPRVAQLLTSLSR